MLPWSSGGWSGGLSAAGKAAPGFLEAPLVNPAPLLINVCFLQRRLKYCFETLPCLSIGCADLQSLDTMQPVERKRQGYIHELIQTEERYVDDLQLVVEVRAVPAGWRALASESGVTFDVSERSSHTLRTICGRGGRGGRA